MHVCMCQTILNEICYVIEIYKMILLRVAMEANLLKFEPEIFLFACSYKNDVKCNDKQYVYILLNIISIFVIIKTHGII